MDIEKASLNVTSSSLTKQQQQIGGGTTNASLTKDDDIVNVLEVPPTIVTTTIEALPPASPAQALYSLSSGRGIVILLILCTAQCVDNIFVTSIALALPAIEQEFASSTTKSDLQWCLSAYNLTFGGLLLLCGVLADRYGRRLVFCSGLAFLTVWTLANGVATSFVQITIFRALQGIGAAATVPSACGIISASYIPKDRSKALSIFASFGAVGFTIGVLFGGFLTGALGWRYIFYLLVIVTGPTTVLGWFFLPKDDGNGSEKPKLDVSGAVTSTSGLILLCFVISGGGQYGWSSPFIIALLVLSVTLLIAFVFIESQVANPMMPLSLWKSHNFAVLWWSGFLVYATYYTVIYYTTLQSQEILDLSPGQTALRFLPMGAMGFLISISLGKAVDLVPTKILLLMGLGSSAVAPISAAFLSEVSSNFWEHILPASLLAVAGVSTAYQAINYQLLASVPVHLRSMCGGVLNTAFQLGAGFGLVICTAVVEAVDVKKRHDLSKQYETGLWTSAGMSTFAFVACILLVRNASKDGRMASQ